jgi:hypothetical protein
MEEVSVGLEGQGETNAVVSSWFHGERGSVMGVVATDKCWKTRRATLMLCGSNTAAAQRQLFADGACIEMVDYFIASFC